MVRLMTELTLEQAMAIALGHHRAGRLAEAEAVYRRVLERVPEHADALQLLGILAGQAGHLEAAIELLGQAITREPEVAEHHANLAEFYRRSGRLECALASCRRAIALKPGLAQAHQTLAEVLVTLGRRDEAIAAYGRALELMPENAAILNNLGSALHALGCLDRAAAALGRAARLRPDLAEIAYNLGNVLGQAGRLDEAAAALERAIALRPGMAEAHGNLGNVFKERGEIGRALASYRRAVALRPDYAEAASNLLLALLYDPDADGRKLLDEHRRWARQFAEPLAEPGRRHPNDRSPERRLKVGVLSGDLRSHPVGYSLVPLFEYRDRRQFELVGYSDVRAPDAVTARLHSLADAWRDAAALDHRQLAELIRADRVDILIDPSLHTAGNRLLVLARQPAPVQLTMLGPPATTGLATIGYRITDPYLDPPGTGCDADYTERSIRLPHCFWVYLPPEEAPDVVAPPALASGRITFGCLSGLHKVSRPAQRLWAKVLRRLPEARLLIQAQPGSHREPIRQLFRDEGIEAGRIEFTVPVARREYFRGYHELDISLDPLPYNGHTRAMDSLWMGVPVVTLAGRTAVGRGGVSLLSNVGLPELIARTEDEYVEIAVALASDPDRLELLRAGLRQQVLDSPLCDGPRFAADVAAALRSIWREWCVS
jgi:predicted O-linked N-acetylglucosamine transferase (SPINDLY family)